MEVDAAWEVPIIAVPVVVATLEEHAVELMDAARLERLALKLVLKTDVAPLDKPVMVSVVALILLKLPAITRTFAAPLVKLVDETPMETLHAVMVPQFHLHLSQMIQARLSLTLIPMILSKRILTTPQLMTPLQAL